jgi:hypothetical protein
MWSNWKSVEEAGPFNISLPMWFVNERVLCESANLVIQCRKTLHVPKQVVCFRIRSIGSSPLHLRDRVRESQLQKRPRISAFVGKPEKFFAASNGLPTSASLVGGA